MIEEGIKAFLKLAGIKCEICDNEDFETKWVRYDVIEIKCNVLFFT